MRPSDFKFKSQPTKQLFLLLCLIGVALVAWGAWAAGPIRTKSAIQTSPTSQAQSTLINPGYNPLQSASLGSSASSASVPISGSTASPVAPPASAQPSYPFCYPRGGIQPDIANPCNCRAYGSAYSCCGVNPGSQIACPEPTY